MLTQKHAKGKIHGKLVRTTFKTSRVMDFFTEKELVTQTGHEVRDWPLVIVKELVDNALDACEDADIAPIVLVTADAAGITVTDNGPGLPETTLEGAMDFTIRASNREAYVSPCRGAQGNALKTLLPMPWVIDAEHGRFIVVTGGKRHVITCGADPISQRAVIHRDPEDLAKSKNSPFSQNGKSKLSSGTSVRLEWAPRDVVVDEKKVPLWPFDNLEPLTGYDGRRGIAKSFHRLVEGFAVFNPHATITLDWFGKKATWKATDTSWSKWKPCWPTSAHWYEQAHLERLVGAYLTHDRDNGKDRLVSEFVAEFDGLTGSMKRNRVLTDAGLKRVHLSELVVNDRLDSERIAKLLTAMRAHSKPVKDQSLGMIGEDHLKARLLAMGVLPESFRYSRKLATAKSKKSQSAPEEKASFSELPGVLESAFGYLGPDAKDYRRIYAGANWSTAIGNPFRSFGDTGEGLETTLAHFRATSSEPVVFVLHLAQPRVQFTDRGKSALVIGGVA
jgi:hypothetical protein